MLSKLLQPTPIAPIAAFHVSLIVGAVSFISRNLEPNSLVGIRVPRTVNDPAQWKVVHGRASRLMPCLSGLCAAAAVTAFWIPAMRTMLASLILIGTQILALFACAVL